MAADGKNASGRLAAATVLWLLIALFANQDYVFCDDEPTPEQQQQEQQKQQQQLTQQLTLQQQPPQQQSSQEQSLQEPLLQQLTPQQQLLQQLTPQQQLPQPLTSQQQLPQPLTPQQQLPQPLTSQQQLSQPLIPQQQQQSPQQLTPQQQSLQLQSTQQLTPQQKLKFQIYTQRLQQLQQQQLPQPLPQPQISQTPQTQESPSLEIMGSQKSMENLKRGPQMVLDFKPNQPNQIPQLQLSPGTMPGGEQIPTLNSNPQSFLTNQQLVKLGPPLPVNGQIQDLPSIPQYSAQIQQKPMMSLSPQMQRFPSNNFPSITPSVNQQHFNGPTNTQLPHQSQSPNYSQVYAEDRYEIPMQTSSNTPAFPGQSYLPTNFGSDMMQPMNMFTNMMPQNTMQIVQKPINLAINSIDKAGKYVHGLKEGLTTVFVDVAGRIIDQGQSAVHKILDLSRAGTDGAFNFNRYLFIPAFRNQQVAGSVGAYNYPQPGSPSNVQGFNSRLQPSTEPQGGMQGYNTLQPQTSGSFAGQQSSTQGTAPPQTQYSEYGTQQDQGMNYGNPVSSSQPIVRYGS